MSDHAPETPTGSARRTLATLGTWQNWEDFPIHYRGRDADSLLGSWTSLWHPALLWSSQGLPQIISIVDYYDIEPQTLVTVSEPTWRQAERMIQESPPTDFQLFRGATRGEFTAALLSSLAADPPLPQFSERVVAHCWALGYAVMQIQLMTRQLRYSSSLDWSELEARTRQGLESALSDSADNEFPLMAAFDLLLDEKNRYYPMVANFLDLTLLHPGAQAQLRGLTEPVPKRNWLCSGIELSSFFANSEWQAEIRAEVSRGSLELVGGGAVELPELWSDVATAADNLRLGQQLLSEIGGRPVAVFGRRSSGLHGGLPQWLTRLGYQGALFVDFEGAILPGTSAPLFSWQADDGTQLSALGLPVQDASQPESVLALGVVIGEQIDSYHTATVIWAHWPGERHPYFQDLLWANAHGNLLGRFQTVSETFEGFYNPGYGETWEYDDLRADELTRWTAAGEGDPISRLARWVGSQTQLSSVEWWIAIYEILTCRPHPLRQPARDWRRRAAQMAALTPGTVTNSAAGREQSAAIAAARQQIERDVLREVGWQPELVADGAEDSGATEVVLNAGPTPVADGKRPLNASPTPGYGYSWAAAETVNSGPKSPANSWWGRSKSRGSRPAMVADGYLRNEFFAVDIDERTGGIRSLKHYRPRAANVCSQQLAWRCDPPGGASEEPTYAAASLQALEFQELDSRTAVARARGEWRCGEQVLGRFQQETIVRRGSRAVELRFQVDLLASLPATPWQHYIANRLAWLNQGARRWRRLHHGWRTCYLERFAAPQGLWIDDVEEPLLWEMDGWGWQSMSRLNTVDTLLVTAGETTREFCGHLHVLGAGGRPPAAQSVAQQSRWRCRPSSAEVATSLNLERAGERQFISLQPAGLEIVEVETIQEAGKIIGCRIWIAECFQEGGRFRVGLPRPISRAQAIDWRGFFLHDVDVKQGDALGNFHPYQIFGLQLYW